MDSSVEYDMIGENVRVLRSIKDDYLALTSTLLNVSRNHVPDQVTLNSIKEPIAQQHKRNGYIMSESNEIVLKKKH